MWIVVRTTTRLARPGGGTHACAALCLAGAGGLVAAAPTAQAEEGHVAIDRALLLGGAGARLLPQRSGGGAAKRACYGVWRGDTGESTVVVCGWAGGMRGWGTKCLRDVGACGTDHGGTG